MARISRLTEDQRVAIARQQPSLSFLSFSLPDLLRDIRSDVFPDITHRVGVYFVMRGSLGCVVDTAGSASIFIHHATNHIDTPREVIAFLLKHELLHLRIPPMEINGVERSHPPQFWEAERAICPEREAAWNWLWVCLGSYLRPYRGCGQITVLAKWKDSWCEPRLSLAECEEMVSRGYFGQAER